MRVKVTKTTTFDKNTVIFACRRSLLIMIPSFELRLKISDYSPVRVDEEDLIEVLQESEALPRAAIIFAFGDTRVSLVNSLIAEFPSLHVIYWYIPWVDSAPSKDARVHLFSSMSPKELLQTIEEC